MSASRSTLLPARRLRSIFWLAVPLLVLSTLVGLPSAPASAAPSAQPVCVAEQATEAAARRARPGRARRMIAVVTTAAFAGSLVQAPAWAERDKPFTPPSAQKIDEVPVTEVKSAAAKAQPTMPDATKKAAPTWPKAGAGEVSVPSTATAKAGDLPVTVGRPGTKKEAPAKVGVSVLDRTATEKAGVRGLLMRVGRTAQDPDAGAVDMTVDYSTFRTAYGGDWASRLRLVSLPACALTTPEKRECTGTPLKSRNDPKKSTVTATVDVAGDSTADTSTLVAVAAGTSGEAGSFAATKLQPSSTSGRRVGTPGTSPGRIRCACRRRAVLRRPR